MDFKKKWKEFQKYLRAYPVGKTDLENVLTKVAIFLMLLIIIPFLFSADKSEKSLDMKIGSISTKKVVAPFNFYILKTNEELKSERQANVNKVPFYFNYNDSLTQTAVSNLEAVLDYIIMANKDARKNAYSKKDNQK